MNQPSPSSVYRIHTSPISSLGYLDSSHLLTGDQSGLALILHRLTKRPVFSFQHSSSVLSVLISSDRFLIQTRSSNIHFYDSTTFQERSNLKTNSSSFCRCALKNNYLANSSEDENELAIWDLDNNKSSSKIFSFSDKSHGMLMETRFLNTTATLPEYVAGVYEDGQLLVYSLKSGSSSLPLISLIVQENKTVATSFDLTPTSEENVFQGLGGGSSDVLSMFKFNLSTGESSIKQFPASHTPGRGLGVGQITIRQTMEHRIAAIASWDSRVRIVHVKSGKHLAVLKHHKESCNCVSFSPCGQYLSSGGKDCLIAEWDNLYI